MKLFKTGILLFAVTMIISHVADAGWPYSVTNTYNTGDIITASKLNTSNTEHINNNIPESIDDFSADVTEMQSTADPGEVGTESLATTLDGELKRIRNVFKEITGEAQWYVTPGDAYPITNITPAANFTITQNSVVPFTSVETGAVVDTLYLNAGDVGVGTNTPSVALDVVGSGNFSAGLTAGTSMTGSYLTASEMLVSDASKNIVSADVATYPSLTELTYLKGVTSAIQTQMDLKAPLISPSFTTPDIGVATGTSLGIGTATPSGELEVSSIGTADIYIDSAAGSNANLFLQAGGVGIGSIEQQSTAAGNFFITNAIDQGDIVFRTVDTTVQTDLTIYENGNISMGNGNMGIGTATFGTGAASVIGIANGTAPSSSPANMVQLYAEDVSSSSELRVRDEIGNVTTLSPHAKDAPDWMYDRGKGLDEMHRVANGYKGEIIFINETRKDNLIQLMLEGKPLPIGNDIKFRFVETYEDYNLRTGSNLKIEDWNVNQSDAVTKRQEEIDSAIAKINKLDAEIAVEVDEDIIKEKTRQRNSIKVPKVYTPKVKPVWIKKK